MSELKVIGTIKQIGELIQFDSGFSKVEFVITTDETYPQEVKFEAVKEKAEKFLQYNKVGARVEVKFNIRGNEYNGKHYVSLQSWHVQNVESGYAEGVNTGATVPTQAAQPIEDLPF